MAFRSSAVVRALHQGLDGRHKTRIQAPDVFLEAAAHEYQTGKVDKALWARTQGIAGDDESLAIAAYLRARAALLREDHRNARAARAEGSAGAPGQEELRPNHAASLCVDRRQRPQ